MHAQLAIQRHPDPLVATRNCNVYLRSDIEELLAARGGRITAGGSPKSRAAAKQNEPQK
jgi:hypothetical protein